MLRLEAEEGGGAGIIRMKVDSYLERGGKVESAKTPVVVTFFFPNYDPDALKEGDLIWVYFELYSDWEDVRELSKPEKWVKPVTDDTTSYQYSLAGEMFQLSEPGRDEELYVNAEFPIVLTLGLPRYPNKPGPIRNGQYVQISRGNLYGHVELWDPEFKPVAPK